MSDKLVAGEIAPPEAAVEEELWPQGLRQVNPNPNPDPNPSPDPNPDPDPDLNPNPNPNPDPDPNPNQAKGLCASHPQVMDPGVLALARDCTYGDIHCLLKQSDAAEFPLVESAASPLLVGAVRRSGLERLLARQMFGPAREQARVIGA